MKKYFKILVLILFSHQVSPISGQALSDDFNKSAHLDESITFGKLENGLTYYIKPLPESGGKINLRFHVLAGIHNQDLDQLNFAHFVEHMAFKATKNFPNGIRHALKSSGNLKMGKYDVGGTAGPYHSRYSFDAPVDNQEALETGLLWFKDIATGLQFLNEEIDTERGVLVQEFMFRTPDDMQSTFTRNKLLIPMVPCQENYSGFLKHHETFNPGLLKQFYNDWYRPDLMTIVIVGKIENIASVEKQIINQFSDIPPKEHPREVPDCDNIFFDQPTQFIVVEKESDSQHSDNKVEMEILYRDQKMPELISSLEGIKRLHEIDLFTQILNNRLAEAKGYGNFYDIRMQYTYRVSKTPPSFKVFLTSYNNSEKKALQSFTHAVEQIQHFGVLESEFKDIKTNRINQIGKIDDSRLSYWINEIENYLVFDEALPLNKLEYIREWLSDYDLREFEEFIKEISFEMPHIGIIAPSNHQVLSFDESEIRSWIYEIQEGPIRPYELPETSSDLISSSEDKRLLELPFENNGVKESGAHEIILANGVKIFLKTLTPSPGIYQDKIMLHGFNGRGALDFPAKDYFSAINTPWFIKHSGVGNFNKFELQRLLSNSSLFMSGINLYVNNQEAGIKLHSSPEDVQKMLQLVYLMFSQPRQDSLAFQDWKVQQAVYYRNQPKVEQHDFINNIRRVLGDNSGVSSGTERRLGLDDTDMERGFKVYKELFGNARDFTFIISGNFTLDSMIPLVNKYLGNLPSLQSDKQPQNRDAFILRPLGPIFTQFNFSDSYSKTNYFYRPSYIIPAENKENWKERLLVRALGRILQAKVWALRFDKGYALYSFGASGKYDRDLNQYEFAAKLDCTPEDYSLLRQEFSQIITELKSELVPKEMMSNMVSEMQGIYSGVDTHRYIHDKLYQHVRFEETWTNDSGFIPYINSLTREDMKKAAQRYFKDEYLYEFVMIN